jgi:hypothetical protein
MMNESPGPSDGPNFDDVATNAAIKQATSNAKKGAQKAAAAVSTGAREVVLYVRQGPTGVSVLCVIGGLATIISSFLGLINVLGLITPISYLVNFYTLMFGFMTVFLEAEPERMKGSIVLSRCIGVCGWGRAHVLEYFKFTTSLTGRGLFYIFLGSFGVIQWTWISVIVGVWMMVCGVLLIMMRCGCEKRPPPQQQEEGAEQI